MAICLAQLRRLAIMQIQGEFTKSGIDIGPDMLDPWLSDAYVEIQRLKVYSKTATQATVADQSRYSRPADILDFLTFGRHAIRVTDAAGNIARPLLRTWDYMTEVYGNFLNPNGNHGVLDWCWDRANTEQIVLQYPPADSVASGLAIDYAPHPGELSRVYDPDTATCSVTNGSAVVTFAASIGGLLVADDVFGVKADSDSLPTSWYRILSVDSTTQITLTGVYAGATDAAALFTTSQVSPLEWARPGLVQYAPIDYVLSRVAEMERGKQESIVYMQGWAAELARIAIESRRQPGLELGGQRASQTHPALNPLTRRSR